jgi:hypothetical protein
MSEDETSHKPGSKFYWGPRMWALLHILADISNRRDVGQLWSSFLQASANVLPCPACKQHFQNHLRTHRMIPNTNPLQITGQIMRHQIRTSLHQFHNDVNRRLAKPTIPFEITRPPNRPQALEKIQTLMSEVQDAWTPLIHTSIQLPAYNHWKSVGNVLIALLSGGPN